MQVTNAVLEELNSRVNIVELISQYVNLKKSGRNFIGLCPFHSEKTPSFSVSEEKGLFHCFGCKASGNSITFVMKYNNFDFVQAVQYLCEKYNVEFEQKEVKGRKEILSLNEVFMNIAKRKLYSGKHKFALEYLNQRGFDTEILDVFDIGFVPEDIDIKTFFSEFTTNELFDSGIFYRRGKDIKIRFSNRILIPIKGENGKVLGFSGRIIEKGEHYKYVNSPETKVFKKREVLFNLNLAKDYIKKEGNVYIVEGYFDVMRMYGNGYKNCVSPMGTSFTSSQVSLLKRFADEGVVIFDGDDAGFKASLRALDVSIESNFFPSVVFMPKGDDPDSLLLRNPEEFKKVLKNKQDMMLFLFKSMSKKNENPNIKSKNARELFRKTEKIKDPIMRDYYRSELSKIFSIDLELLKVSPSSDYFRAKNPENSNVSYFCEEEFLYCLINLDDDLVDGIVSDMDDEMFLGEKTKKIFKKIVEFLKNSGSIPALLNDGDCGGDLSKLILRYDSMSLHPDDKDFFYRTALANKQKIKKNYFSGLRLSLVKKLSSGAVTHSESLEILGRIKEIIEEEKRIQID